MTEKVHEIYAKFFQDKYRTEVMLEGPLVLHKKAKNHIFPFFNENSDNFSFFISRQLLDTILQSKEVNFQKLVSFYGICEANLRITREMLLEIEKTLNIFELSKDNFEKIHSDKNYSYFYENLKKQIKDDFLTNFLFDEWIFLQQHSTLVSAFKRAFTIFKSCGAVVVEYSRKAWDKIIEKFDKHVKREFLNNIDNNIITNSIRLQYLGKWIGRNWPELLMMNPYLIFPALGLRVLMGFILIDP